MITIVNKAEKYCIYDLHAPKVILHINQRLRTYIYLSMRNDSYIIYIKLAFTQKK